MHLKQVAALGWQSVLRKLRRWCYCGNGGSPISKSIHDPSSQPEEINRQPLHVACLHNPIPYLLCALYRSGDTLSSPASASRLPPHLTWVHPSSLPVCTGPADWSTGLHSYRTPSTLQWVLHLPASFWFDFVILSIWTCRVWWNILLSGPLWKVQGSTVKHDYIEYSVASVVDTWQSYPYALWTSHSRFIPSLVE